jgi:hypothetical protein
MAVEHCAALQELCLGLAAAVIKGEALAPATLAALRQGLPEVDSLRYRVALVVWAHASSKA